MTGNTDAALVRGLEKLRRYGGNAVLGEDEANAVIDEYDRLAAAAERADEAERVAKEHEGRSSFQSHRNVLRRAEAAEAALLAAQQERDALMAVVQAERPPEHVVRFFQRLHGLPEVGHLDWQARAERAEATATRLREALKEIAEDRVPTTYGGGQRAARECARAALAQDAEQETA